METPHIVIIGAGMAGLACAAALAEADVTFELFEASDSVGGRVRTDVVDGYRLDRGFQVLQTAYPFVGRWLKPKELRLRAFQPGALVRIGDRFQPFHDVSRLPLRVLGVLMSSVGTLGDKLKLRKLRQEVVRGAWDSAFSAPDMTSLEFLRERGFSDTVIERFFRPFFGGVMLDRNLETSARMLRFTLRMFSEGYAALPAEGMEAIPKQLAARLAPEAIHLGKKVTTVFKGRVIFEGGGSIWARRIVVATDGKTAAKIDHRIVPPRFRSTHCFHYGFEGELGNGGFLMLNGEGRGPVNHAAIVSEVAPEYAPPGRSLISVNVVGDHGISGTGLEAAARAQISSWLKVDGNQLKLLKAQDIPLALPCAEGNKLDYMQVPPEVGDDLLVCGDHTGIASLQGAVDSGIRVAQRIAREVKERSSLDWLD